MGIHNLNKILKKYVPCVYKQVDLKKYAFKKIAIDISLYLYKYKATNGFFWLKAFLDLVSCFRKLNIHCLFVYDGIAPIEKLKEQERRRSVTQSQKNKIKEIEKEIEIYNLTNEIGNYIKEIYDKEVPKIESLCRPGGKCENHIDKDIAISLAIKKVENMKNMLVSITEEDINLSKKLFNILNIPFLEAPDEAERYCAQLCNSGIVDAVLSDDTDVLVYGTPYFLTNINTYNNTVIEICNSELLFNLEMDLYTFRDFCILLGCDYNTNIYGYGPEKVLKLITKYKNIEDIIKNLPLNTDTESLNYSKCRELFFVDKIDIKVPYCGCPDFNKLFEFLKQNNIDYNKEKIYNIFNYQNLIFSD